MGHICLSHPYAYEAGGAATPPGLKNFGASASCSKILNDKKYFNTVKNSRATLFTGQAQVAQKS